MHVATGITASKSFGAVAQLGEHRLCKPGVTGSIPVSSTREPGKTGPHRETTKRIAGISAASRGLESQMPTAHERFDL